MKEAECGEEGVSGGAAGESGGVVAGDAEVWMIEDEMEVWVQSGKCGRWVTALRAPELGREQGSDENGLWVKAEYQWGSYADGHPLGQALEHYPGDDIPKLRRS